MTITETYKGRKLKVTKDRRTMQVATFVNGVNRGSWIGTEDAELASLKRTIDAIDSEPVNGDRWTAEWYAPGTFELCSNGHPKALDAACKHSTCAPAADDLGKPVAVRRPAGGMSIRLIKMVRRTRTAARTIAQALVSAVRGRMFRLIADLYRAIDGRLPVHIGYVKSSGERSERVIEPHELIVTGPGNITVTAFDRRDAEDTTFRVDRITHHNPTAQEVAVTTPPQPAPVPVDSDATAHQIIRELDEAWTRLIGVQMRLDLHLFSSWQDQENHYGYQETALRTIAARRADLDRPRAERAAFEARVDRLAGAAATTGNPALTAVTHLVYGDAVLAGLALEVA